MDDPIHDCFQTSYRRLVGQLYGVCGDLTEAEEVVAEAFARAVDKRRVFERLDNPEAWLRTVSINIARTRHRRRKLGEKLLGRTTDGDLDHHPDLGEDRLVLVVALRQLSRVHREALALHCLADLPVGEVAETLGVPLRTVKARGAPDPAGPRPATPSATRADPAEPRPAGGLSKEEMAETIVDAPEAGVAAIAVNPENTDIRAVAWTWSKWGQAVAITGDGFATRTTVAVEGTLLHLADATFAVATADEVHVLEVGDQRTLQVGPAAPATGEETVVRVGGGPTGQALIAIDPAGEAAHLVSIPEVQYWDLQALGGRLQAIEYRDDQRESIGYHWSDDGGATWDAVEVASNWWSFIVPTGPGEDHLIVESGDGATVSPLIGLHVMSPADERGFGEVLQRQEGFLPAGGAFFWDGVVRLFDPVAPADGSETFGLFGFDDRALVELAHEMPEIERDVPHGVVSAPEPDRPILWIADGDRLHLSVDGGVTWEESATR